MNKVYIKSIAHISVQKPLTEEWMTDPLTPTEIKAPVQEPVYSDWISPMASRRMAKVMKRAVVTSKAALSYANLSTPDAIISATGLGCVEFTEKFLQSISDNSEECLPPTLFMNSTHNTISSQIALSLNCHGYNNTWSHGIISFQSALADGVTLIRQGMAENVLVGGFDEMTPDKFAILDKIHFWEGSFCGETSLSTVISSDPSRSICEVSGIEILFRPSQIRIRECLEKICQDAGISVNEIGMIVSPGKEPVLNIPEVPIFRYETVFGRSFTGAAAGYHAGAMFAGKNGIRNVLVIDGDGTTHISIILLK